LEFPKFPIRANLFGKGYVQLYCQYPVFSLISFQNCRADLIMAQGKKYQNFYHEHVRTDYGKEMLQYAGPVAVFLIRLNICHCIFFPLK